MEEYKSKYYNIEKFGDSWKKEDLILMLQFLENADVKTLQKIVTDCGVRFSGGNENVTSQEELVGVLLGHDVSRGKLVEIVEKFK